MSIITIYVNNHLLITRKVFVLTFVKNSSIQEITISFSNLYKPLFSYYYYKQLILQSKIMTFQLLCGIFLEEMLTSQIYHWVFMWGDGATNFSRICNFLSVLVTHKILSQQRKRQSWNDPASILSILLTGFITQLLQLSLLLQWAWQIWDYSLHGSKEYLWALPPSHNIPYSTCCLPSCWIHQVTDWQKDLWT